MKITVAKPESGGKYSSGIEKAIFYQGSGENTEAVETRYNAGKSGIDLRFLEYGIELGISDYLGSILEHMSRESEEKYIKFSSNSEIVDILSTDKLEAISDLIVPTQATESENTESTKYFGSFSTGIQKIYVLVIDAGISRVELLDEDNILALTIEFDEALGEISSGKVLFISESDSGKRIENFRVAYEAWLKLSDPFRHVPEEAVRKAEKEKEVDQFKKVNDTFWFDNASGTLLGTSWTSLENISEKYPILKNKRNAADNLGWSRYRVYKRGEKIMFRGMEYMSTINNNLGNYPVMSADWIKTEDIGENYTTVVKVIAPAFIRFHGIRFGENSSENTNITFCANEDNEVIIPSAVFPENGKAIFVLSSPFELVGNSGQYFIEHESENTIYYEESYECTVKATIGERGIKNEVRFTPYNGAVRYTFNFPNYVVHDPDQDSGYSEFIISSDSQIKSVDITIPFSESDYLSFNLKERMAESLFPDDEEAYSKFLKFLENKKLNFEGTTAKDYRGNPITSEFSINPGMYQDSDSEWVWDEDWLKSIELFPTKGLSDLGVWYNPDDSKTALKAPGLCSPGTVNIPVETEDLGYTVVISNSGDFWVSHNIIDNISDFTSLEVKFKPDAGIEFDGIWYNKQFSAETGERIIINTDTDINTYGVAVSEGNGEYTITFSPSIKTNLILDILQK